MGRILKIGKEFDRKVFICYWINELAKSDQVISLAELALSVELVFWNQSIISRRLEN